MSEAKSEVEYVIKTGRQIVEKKQVDNTEQLSSQIDAIKLLYNELGAQVPQFTTIHFQIAVYCFLLQLTVVYFSHIV